MTLPIVALAHFAGSQRVAPALRLNGTDERMQRTASVGSAFPGSHRKTTFSAWLRPTTVSAFQPIYTVDNGAVSTAYFAIGSDGTLRFLTDDAVGGIDCNAQGTGASLVTDVWQHAFCAYDSTQGTAADRVKFWLDGVQLATNYIAGAAPSLNLNNVFWFNTLVHSLGFHDNSGGYFEGDMALVYGIDGAAMSVTDFADTIDGVYQAKRPTPSYDTNGFFFDFGDPADLGRDFDNGNDHTLSNIDASNSIGDGPPVSY